MSNQPDSMRPGAGYRMPAEWEPHQATWVSWPHKESSWPGKLPVIEPVFAQMVAAICRSETVHINVNHASMEQHARALLQGAGATGDIRFHQFPTNDAWCRDHGAIFITRNDDDADAAPLAATNWGYNAWGNKYPPYDLDDQIPLRMSEYLDVPRFDGGMILEGGSIDVNGQGLLLTTEACLLNPNRNPQLSRAGIEQRLTDFLSIGEILWLGDGIVGDDTDGHVDDITRFVSELTVVTCVERDPGDENYQPLQENLQRLQSFRTREGRSLDVIELPMPPAVIYEEQRLPASYANFYIANAVVLLPGYRDQARDAEAKQILQSVFPDREVVQIDCTDLIWGLGAFHCLTQQVPATSPR